MKCYRECGCGAGDSGCSICGCCKACGRDAQQLAKKGAKFKAGGGGQDPKPAHFGTFQFTE